MQLVLFGAPRLLVASRTEPELPRQGACDMIAVSYTHLDVYKRQFFNSFCLFNEFLCSLFTFSLNFKASKNVH